MQLRDRGTQGHRDIGTLNLIRTSVRIYERIRPQLMTQSKKKLATLRPCVLATLRP